MITSKKHEKLVHCQRCGKLYVRTGMNNKFCGERNGGGCSRLNYLEKHKESDRQRYCKKFGSTAKENRLKRFKKEVEKLVKENGKKVILKIIEEVRC
jgi:hypothetical protein